MYQQLQSTSRHDQKMLSCELRQTERCRALQLVPNAAPDRCQQTGKLDPAFNFSFVFLCPFVAKITVLSRRRINDTHGEDYRYPETTGHGATATKFMHRYINPVIELATKSVAVRHVLL